MAHLLSETENHGPGRLRSFLTSSEDPRVLIEASPENSFSVVKRNLLSEIHKVTQDPESTILPVPTVHETVGVYLRVKPKTEEEREFYHDDELDVENVDPKFEVVTIESSHQIAIHAPRDSVNYKNSVNNGTSMCHRFSFSKIFPPETAQGEIFNEMVLPKLKDFLEGRNQLLFTYGATSSGKTFTIQGTPQKPGILPRALDAIFNSISSRQLTEPTFKPEGFNRVKQLNQDEFEKVWNEKTVAFKLGKELQSALKHQAESSKMSSASSSKMSVDMSQNSSQMSQQSLATMFPHLSNRWREEASVDLASDKNHLYSVWISFAEIYNENIYDLLEKLPEARRKGEKPRRIPLRLAEDRSSCVYIRGLKEILVNSADEAYQLLMIGRENLQFAATRLNHHSSRSHCIFTIKVIRVMDKDKPHFARMSMLSFCDLAGSERIKKTKNTGERQKEAGNINTSLLVLGRCIKAIRGNQTIRDARKHQMVPFRESKLTRLLQCFFSGKGKCSMVVNVSQSPYLFDESLQVLKFAAIASKVTIEVPKEVEQEEEKLPAKKNRRKSQFSMMVLDKKAKESLLSGRGSIAWENPQLRSTLCPPPDASSTTIEEEDEPSDANDGDVTEEEEEEALDAKYDGLLALIDSLKNELIEEKQKNLTLETEIRTELCTEFETMLVEIESNWEQRLQNERDRAADLAEWRINKVEEAYKERIQQQKKRRRVEEAEESKESNAEKISELETKIKDKEYEVSQLEKQVEAMKSVHNSEVDEKKKLQEQVTKQTFEISTLNQKISELEINLASTSDKLQAANAALEEKSADPRLDSLTQEVSDLKESVSKLKQEKSNLKDLLNQAGKDFLQKDEDVNELTKQLAESKVELANKEMHLKDLETQLEEERQLVSAANANLEEKELAVFELEEQVESLQNQLAKEHQETSHKWLDQKSFEQQIGNLNDEIESLKQEKKKLRALVDEKVALLQTKEVEVKSLEAEVKTLLKQNRETSSNKDEEIARLEKEVKSLIQAENRQEKATSETQAEVSMLRKQIGDLNVKLSEAEGLSKKLKEKQVTIDQLQLVVDAFKKEDQAVEALRTELDRKSNEKAETELKLAEMESSMQSVNYELDRTKTQKDELMKHYEQTIKKLTDELATERNERKQIREVMARSTPKKSSQMEQELASLKEELKSKSFKILEVENEIERMKEENSNFAVKEIEWERQIKALKDELKSKTNLMKKNTSLQKEVHTLREEVKAKSELVKNLSDQIAPASEQSEEDLKAKIDSLQNEIAQLKAQQGSEIAKANEAIKMYKEQNAVLVKRVAATCEETAQPAGSKSATKSKTKRAKTLSATQLSSDESSLENDNQEEDRHRSSSPPRKTPRRGARVSGKRPAKTRPRLNAHVSFADDDDTNKESDESFAAPSSVGKSRKVRASSVSQIQRANALSPLDENQVAESPATLKTPGSGKKKLFSSSDSVEFTPPEVNLSVPSSSRSIVGRNLRSRSAKK